MEKVPLSPASQGLTTYACLLMSSSDKIRLIAFPADVYGAIENAIVQVWAPGIQNKGSHGEGIYEWKLSGRPWYGSGSEAVPARRLMAHILHSLAVCGWHLAFSTDLSKKGNDKDTLYFKPGVPRQRYIFPMSFNESDKLRLIDSPNPGVTEAFKAAARTWPLGLQGEKEKEHGCLQMKLRGHPWYTSDGTEVNSARILGMSILNAMESQGFELIGSIDMSARHGSESSPSSELDTWFFADK